jgi:hypothetical protein
MSPDAFVTETPSVLVILYSQPRIDTAYGCPGIQARHATQDITLSKLLRKKYMCIS